MTVAVRTLTVWCADWPVVALGWSLKEPVAVVYANRVVASSPAARECGVVCGLRRRVAQGRCVELKVCERDLDSEARTFEPVLGALDDITPDVEVTYPGTCMLATRGPARYFGGEVALAELVLAKTSAVVDDLLAGGHSKERVGVVHVGIADGPFAAWLAARSAKPIRIIEAGHSAEFLAPLPITVLREATFGLGLADRSGSGSASVPANRTELTDVLERLGLHTLGAFADLQAGDVLARFGNEGISAHRLARGLDERVPKGRLPTPDWSVASEIDPPADRIDRVAFCARSLADALQQRLRSEGLECVRVAIAAETEHGESMVRVWCHHGALSAALIADRLRWQLDGWLSGRSGASKDRPSGGITRVVLAPQEVVAAGSCQLDFWGNSSANSNDSEIDRRAERVVARLQGQLGTEAVRVPVYHGGRHHHEQLKLVPLADVELFGRSVPARDAPMRDAPIGGASARGALRGGASRGARADSADGVAPWPGSLPAPSPAQVLSAPCAAELLDVDGGVVGVSGRGLLLGVPHLLVVNAQALQVMAWAGPWLLNERWWDDEKCCRQARMQLLTDDGLARLVVLEAGLWRVVAVWD